LLGGFVSVLAGCDGPSAPTATVVEMAVLSSTRTGAWTMGDAAQLTATARFSTGITQDVTSQATWSSSAPGVMSVSPTGLATAVTPGQAEISAAYQGSTGRLPLVVQAPASDRIALLSITPPQATVLERGQALTISATVSYALASADCGEVALIIQDQANGRLQPLPPPQVDVTRGAGTVTLASPVTIPEANVTAARAFLALFPCGATATSTVVSVTYAVR
jgi:hypothetical protein